MAEIKTTDYPTDKIIPVINAKKALANANTAISNQTKSTYQSWNAAINQAISKAASQGLTNCEVKNVPRAQAEKFIEHCCKDEKASRYVVYFSGKDSSGKDKKGYIGLNFFPKRTDDNTKYNFDLFFPNNSKVANLKISWAKKDIQAVHSGVNEASEWTNWAAQENTW